MHVDLKTETLLSLTDAAKAVPPVDGRRPHVSTIWRWINKGLRGVRLESVRVGCRICTTHAALARFFDALSNVVPVSAMTDAPTTPKPHTPKRRQKDIERAERELTKAGI